MLLREWTVLLEEVKDLNQLRLHVLVAQQEISL